MRVLQINSVCGVGSTGRIATDLHIELISLSHESFIAYGRGNVKDCDSAIKIGTKWDNYSHGILTRFFDKHGFGSKKSTIRLVEEIKLINPDIIHLHNIHGYYLNVQVLFEFLKEYNKPIVWTLHDCWAFTGHCSHFDYIKCDKWEKVCCNCPQKNEYPKSFIDNSKYNYMKKKELFTGLNNLIIVTPSKWLKSLVEKSYLKEYNITVINNGVDLKKFKTVFSDFRKNYNIEDKFIILGVSSIWNERKGLEYFIDLVNNLDESQIIVLVGLSKSQMEKLPKNIIGIPRTNSVEELAQIYSCADVFLNPTLEDTFPTTNLEALACGIPVLSFNTGGSPEAIDDKTGIIIKTRTLESIMESISLLKKNNNANVKSDCRVKAEVFFNKTKNFFEYIDLYIKMIKEAKL